MSEQGDRMTIVDVGGVLRQGHGASLGSVGLLYEVVAKVRPERWGDALARCPQRNTEGEEGMG